MLEQPKHAQFLTHDSFLECGDPIELDDYVIAEAVERYGILGRVDESCCKEIRRYVFQARTLSVRDRQDVCDILAPFIK